MFEFISFARCIGSTQHLKDRHGSGYILEVKLGHGQGNQEDSLSVFIAGVVELYPGATVVERFGDRVSMKIDSVDRALSKVFLWLEEGNWGCKLQLYLLF